MLTNHYWWIPEALTQQQCDQIDHAAASTQQIEGIHFGGEQDHRTSQISWIYDDAISDMICAWMRQANKQAGWQYDLQIPEAVQYSLPRRWAVRVAYRRESRPICCPYTRPFSTESHSIKRYLKPATSRNRTETIRNHKLIKP